MKKDKLEEFIKDLFIYVRNGKLTKETQTFVSNYMSCYDLIVEFTGRKLSTYLIEYHNIKIEQIIIECYEKIKNLSGINFIDSFILYTERLNYLIYQMDKTFIYLSRFELKANEKWKADNMCELSMNIYKKYYFDKLEIKLFIILNEILIREERNGNTEYRQKIKSIMKIISYMDIIKPKIIRNKQTSLIFWEENEKNKLSSNPLTYQKKWFDYFKEETIIYNKNKAENDNKKFSELEYIKAELKYINEEYERETNYINEIFHNEISDINYEYLIKDKMNKIFKSKKKEEINELFQLFKSNDVYLNLFFKSFRYYIKDQASTLKNNKELTKDPNIFMQALNDLKKKMDEYIILYFENNIEIQKQAKEEFCLLTLWEVFYLLKKDLSPVYLVYYQYFLENRSKKNK